MTKTDLYIEYQKETGFRLDYIIRMAEERDRDYVEWLESMAICYFLKQKVEDKFKKAIDEA